MSLSPSPGTRASCSSCLGALERTSVRPAAGTSVPRWTSCFAETPAPASPSCCSTSTTWCPAASTRQERAPALWVWPPMWWRTQRPGSWCCRPARWSWATTASAASTSSTRWATTRAPCCTRSWSSRPSPLQRYMSPHLIRNRLEVRKRKELSVSRRLCFRALRLESSASWTPAPPCWLLPTQWNPSGTPKRPQSRTSSCLTLSCPGEHHCIETPDAPIHMLLCCKLNVTLCLLRRQIRPHFPDAGSPGWGLRPQAGSPPGVSLLPDRGADGGRVPGHGRAEGLHRVRANVHQPKTERRSQPGPHWGLWKLCGLI